jgi:hypothetical protein
VQQPGLVRERQAGLTAERVGGQRPGRRVDPGLRDVDERQQGSDDPLQDGANLRLYVNGTQVASRALTGAMRTSTGVLRIGGNSIWSEWFAGLIDEVRVYNRALSATEIQADMTTPVT